MKPPQHRESPNITRCQQYAISKHSKNLELNSQNSDANSHAHKLCSVLLACSKIQICLSSGFLSFSLYCPVCKTTEVAVGFSTYLFIGRAETLGFPHDPKKRHGTRRVSLQAVALPVVLPCRLLRTPGPSRQNSVQRSYTNFQAQRCSTTENNKRGKLQSHIRNCS